MNHTVNEVLEFVKENDVKCVRLGFCDPFGFQKNISIMSHSLESAFKHGISIDAHAIKGFTDITHSDLFLFPGPGTLMILPWRPGPGRVVRFFCDIKNPDGSPYSNDGRFILKTVTDRAAKMGYVCKVGAECEFYLFKTDENGDPIQTPLDKGGYLDISPLDKGEDIRRDICLTLEEMGIMPETAHHEQGPGQNEVTFEFGDALMIADNFMTFKSVVKAIAARNGLYASFMPKPLLNEPGSGMHFNLSLMKNGQNIFEGTQEAAAGFIAGILQRIPEITLFLNPLANSYERFGTYEAPRFVSWSPQNRSQLVRIPAATGEKLRMELRSPDPAVNPHIGFALVLAAGLEGIEKNLPLPDPLDFDLSDEDALRNFTGSLTPLPNSFKEAIRLAKESEFVKHVIGDSLHEKFIAVKEKELAEFSAARDKKTFYAEKYFSFI